VRPFNTRDLTYILIIVTRYELHYDLILGGKYTFKLIELHKQYGPIIHITPFELHISDPEFYDEVYASSASNRKRNKYPLFYESFGMDYSMFATIDHDLHKYRRAALNPFFSQQNVRKLQPVIQERVSTMLERIRDFRESEAVLNVSWLYAAFTSGKLRTQSKSPLF
jgi:cytochrome P450